MTERRTLAEALALDPENPWLAALVSTRKHECQRCGSDEWTYVDYGGCSKCRPYEERIEESDD